MVLLFITAYRVAKGYLGEMFLRASYNKVSHSTVAEKFNSNKYEVRPMSSRLFKFSIFYLAPFNNLQSIHHYGILRKQRSKPITEIKEKLDKTVMTRQQQFQWWKIALLGSLHPKQLK